MVIYHSEVRGSPVHGYGMFALEDIPAGTVVWEMDPDEEEKYWIYLEDTSHMPEDWRRVTYQICENVYSGTGLEGQATDGSEHMNHCCDPNLWFHGDHFLVARRDIKAGEELMYDYATSEDERSTHFPMACRCGAARCRGTVTGRDWEIPELQERYKGHFMTWIQKRIGVADGRSIGLFGDHPWMQRWGITVEHSDEIGRFLQNSKPIPKGSVIMVMLPFIVKTAAEIPDHNQAIQVGPDAYSVSVHAEVFDNFPAHSCAPTMVPKVLLDKSVKFRAARDVAPGSVLSFDYEETEWDLVAHGVDFDCACGAATCKRHIVGKRYRVAATADGSAGAAAAPAS